MEDMTEDNIDFMSQPPSMSLPDFQQEIVYYLHTLKRVHIPLLEAYAEFEKENLSLPRFRRVATALR
jgi:hypothetical protein